MIKLGLDPAWTMIKGIMTEIETDGFFSVHLLFLLLCHHRFISILFCEIPEAVSVISDAGTESGREP